jgi:TonB family protein
MENDFKLFLGLSFALHFAVFAVLGLQPKRPMYIVMPIDLMLNTPEASESASKDARLQAPPKPEPKKKDKEILIPKKKQKAREEPAAKKAQPAEESKPAVPQQAQGKTQAQGFSGSISVDMTRFPYAYYTNLIVRKIGRYWQWANEFGRLKSVVYFKILKDGTVSEVTVKEGSGDRLFDEQAVRAVKLASPFPPLPEAYAENDLGVYFEFSYRE